MEITAFRRALNITILLESTTIILPAKRVIGRRNLMFVWCGVLFGLGILAFVDSILNMGDIFRTINSVLFMLLSLGLLVRTTSKMKEKRIEHYESRIFSLEQQVKKMEAEAQRSKADY
jgi:hypothetical protein